MLNLNKPILTKKTVIISIVVLLLFAVIAIEFNFEMKNSGVTRSEKGVAITKASEKEVDIKALDIAH